MSDLANMDLSKAWAACSAWDGIVAPGRFGAEGTGVTVDLHDRLGIASIIAHENRDDALAEALQGRFGLALPRDPGAVRANGRTLVWAGPGQWLLVADDGDGFADDLAALSSHAAVADQSQSRAAFRIGGAEAQRALAKGCMIDLHPAAFPVGSAGLTSIAHIGICLWRTADDAGEASFEIMVPRSMAGSFWSWLAASAAEFGCNVTTGGRG